MKNASKPSRGRTIVRRAVAATIAAAAFVGVSSLPALAASSTYGASSRCQTGWKSGRAVIQAFAAHELVVTYEQCSRFTTTARPSSATIAYAKVYITAPSTNPAGVVESVEINGGEWFAISGGLDRRYWFSIHHTVLRVVGSGNDFDAHIDVLANNYAHHGIYFCFVHACVYG